LKKVIILISTMILSLSASGIEHEFFFSNDLKIKTIDVYTENIQTIKRLPHVIERKNKNNFKLSMDFITTNKDNIVKTKINNLFQDEHKYKNNSKSTFIRIGTIYKIEVTHTKKRFIDATIKEISNYKNDKTNDIYLRVNMDNTYTILNYNKTLPISDSITLKKDLNYLKISLSEIKKQIK